MSFGLLTVEDHIVPADSGFYNCTFTYKYPFDRLIFTKSGTSYSADFLINMEVVNTETEEILRQSGTRKIAVENFDQTESDELYLQGFLNFKLPFGHYEINTSISIHDNKLYPADFSLDLKDSLNNVLKPFVINSYENTNYAILNNSNSIPFTNNNFAIAVPVLGSKSVRIKITQNGDTIINENLTEHFSSNLVIKDFNNELVIPKKTDGKFDVFILDKNLNKLKEGFTQIEVVYDSLNSKKFNTEVRWLKKPKSLRDSDFGLRILSKIQGDEELDKLEDEYEDQELLNEYWKKYDPDTTTRFNELMDLFYRRVDKAAVAFRSVDRRNGALSDRGMVYIKYGPADFTERSFTKENYAVEVWKYDKINKKFIFRDKTGLGNYELVN